MSYTSRVWIGFMAYGFLSKNISLKCMLMPREGIGTGICSYCKNTTGAKTKVDIADKNILRRFFVTQVSFL